MRETVAMGAGDVTPAIDDVLAGQGSPVQSPPSARTAQLCADALELFAEKAAPVGVMSEIGVREFAAIYEGKGDNAERTPLAGIYPRADALALFAVTLGKALSEKIDAFFAERDFALAAMLDAAASAGAEKAADRIEERYGEILAARSDIDNEVRLLRYSPGYCGWHVSGQKALFAALEPEDVGITLRESCLMEPLKSISGVMVAGPAQIHRFEIDYSFCDECRDRACRLRIQRIMNA